MPKEAQELFAAIGRQLPTRWSGNDIVVMDQVIVKGPGYGSGDCRAAKTVVAGTLERVKKVVSLHVPIHTVHIRGVRWRADL